MIRIINGKKYNTETAKLIGEWSYGCGDFSYCHEALYLKKTGEYFLYGEGGPLSPYAVSCGNNQVSGSENIVPISEKKARSWAEKNLSGEEFIEAFGDVEE